MVLELSNESFQGFLVLGKAHNALVQLVDCHLVLRMQGLEFRV